MDSPLVCGHFLWYKGYMRKKSKIQKSRLGDSPGATKFKINDFFDFCSGIF